MSQRSARAESPWALGISVFVAAMLLLAGAAQFFIGLAGVINDEVFAKVSGYIFRFDATVWGWIHMILGVLFILIGWFVLRAASWAIWTAIGLAVVNGVLNIMWLPSQPFWAIVLDCNRRSNHLGVGHHRPNDSGTIMTRGAERLTYEIRVRGELTDALVAALKPLGLHVEPTSNGPILVGVFRDQAELHGALQAMQDLGIELLEMRQRAE